MAVRNYLVLLLLTVATSEVLSRAVRLSNSTESDRKFQDEFHASTVSKKVPLLVEDVPNELCRLTTVDPYVHRTVEQMLTIDKMTLIEYQLHFTNYTHNPLTINVAGAYDAKKWSRVTTAHGQTLLSLAFNYGVLSMMTLTLGTKTLHIELRDSPPGCMAAVSDQHKIDSVRRLLMRDFDADGPITTVDSDRVCHEIIVDDAGMAKFRHSCCYLNSITDNIECTTDIGNVWLNLLHAMIVVIRFAMIFFGPLLFVSAILSASKDHVPYVVRLKSKLEKTVCFYRREKTDLPPVNAKRNIKLAASKGFPKLRKYLKKWNVKFEQPVKVRFPKYVINVDYKRMQKENSVPLGFFYSLFSAVFLCQVRFLEPFRVCCKSKMFRSKRFSIKWNTFCRRIGKILLIVLVPMPFYIRLVIFYEFECEELERRKRAIAVGGLRESLDNSFIQYFTPTHGIFIVMYVLYAAAAIALAFLSEKHRDNRVKKVIINSFRDLKSLKFTDTLSVMACNMVWPLKNFGVLGCYVGIFYWPIAIVGCFIIGICYLLPTVYLTLRMAYHSKLSAVVMSRKSNKTKYRVRVRPDLGVYKFKTESLGRNGEEKRGSDISLDDLDHVVPKEHMKEDVASVKSTLIHYPKSSWLRIAKYVLCALLSIFTLFSVMLILSEVVGCLVEIVVFTVMGCIVNAEALLKYVMLVIMILVYCGDCFNTMEQKYLKMNRALFNEVKFRIKDLEKVTSLPSSLQKNFGFKAQELNEQADYEAPDDVVEKPANHWMINDLVLFVDSEDTPRIPIQLFNEVIKIRVAGVPGPIYRAYIEVFKQLSKIFLFVFFVFLVVLSFGSVHKISATNQTLATLVVGFIPRMLRMFLAPPRPEVELGTVRFKSKMDEVIKNFCQYWPIYDLPFEVVGDDDKDKQQREEVTAEEVTAASISLEPESKNCDSTLDRNDTHCDEFDRAERQRSFSNQLEKTSDTVAVSADEEIQVDIAICLPSWPDDDQEWVRHQGCNRDVDARHQQESETLPILSETRPKGVVSSPKRDRDLDPLAAETVAESFE